MKYLLDTHTFMWADSEPASLSSRVASLVHDSSNTIFLSLVSIWEIQIKHQSGKLNITMPLADIIERHQRENGIELLPITLPHVLELDNLPLHHRDPFDRLLIAQARLEDIALLSHDSIFAKYAVPVIW